MELNEISDKIIGCALEVHRNLGPGLLEKVYEDAMRIEFGMAGLAYEFQKEIPVHYIGRVIGRQRLDILVEDQVVVELKAAKELEPLFSAQLLGYLRLGGYPLGLLINFNTKLLKQGIKRLII